MIPAYGWASHRDTKSENPVKYKYETDHVIERKRPDIVVVEKDNKRPSHVTSSVWQTHIQTNSDRATDWRRKTVHDSWASNEIPKYTELDCSMLI